MCYPDLWNLRVPLRAPPCSFRITWLPPFHEKWVAGVVELQGERAGSIPEGFETLLSFEDELTLQRFVVFVAFCTVLFSRKAFLVKLKHFRWYSVTSLFKWRVPLIDQRKKRGCFTGASARHHHLLVINLDSSSPKCPRHGRIFFSLTHSGIRGLHIVYWGILAESKYTMLDRIYICKELNLLNFLLLRKRISPETTMVIVRIKRTHPTAIITVLNAASTKKI